MAEIREPFLQHSKNIQNGILLRLWSQTESNTYCDVGIKVYNRTIQAHANVLSASSSYFEKFLAGLDITAPGFPHILDFHSQFWDDSLSDQYENCMEMLIKYLYTGKIEINENNVNILNDIASFLQLDNVLEYCSNFIHNSNNFGSNNCNVFHNCFNNMVDVSTSTTCENTDSDIELVAQLSKRKRGRPKKGHEVNPRLKTEDDDKEFKVNDNRIVSDQLGTRRSNRKHKPIHKSSFSNNNKNENFDNTNVKYLSNSQKYLTDSEDGLVDICIVETDDPNLKRIKYQCEECSFVCEKRCVMDDHMRMHIIENKKCPYCFCDFESSETVQRHLKENHIGPDKFQCRTCMLSFATLRRLQLHLPKHSNNRPFTCDICNVSFKWKHQLKVHYKVHSGDKPHLCDVCGYATAYPAQLRAHDLIHSGKTMVCPVTDCNFQTIKKQNLQGHLRTHAREKPHQCDVCGQSFSLQKNLKRHMYVHMDEKPYNCAVKDCNFTCTRADKLRDHVYRQHGIGKPPIPRPKISQLVARDNAVKAATKELESSVLTPFTCTDGDFILIRSGSALDNSVDPLNENIQTLSNSQNVADDPSEINLVTSETINMVFNDSCNASISEKEGTIINQIQF